MTEIATIDWFGRWGTSVFSENTAVFSSSFFLYNFQTLKVFVILFSGTVRPRRLKLGTHVDSGLMYRVYWNMAAAAYSSLYFFIFLSLQFSNIKIFRQLSPIIKHWTFLWEFSWELSGLEGWNFVETLPVGGCIVYKKSGCCCLFILLIFHFSSLQFSNIKNFCHIFLRNCEA